MSGIISSRCGSLYASRSQFTELFPTCCRDDIEEIKEQLSNVKAEMYSLNERYDALSASYLNLHEKFDFFQNEASVYESTTKLPLPVQNHDNIHCENVKYADFSASLVRVISIDSKSKVEK